MAFLQTAWGDQADIISMEDICTLYGHLLSQDFDRFRQALHAYIG